MTVTFAENERPFKPQQVDLSRLSDCHLLNCVTHKHIGIVDFRPRTMNIYAQPLDQVGIRWEVLPAEMLPAIYGAVLAMDEGRAGREENQILQAGLTYLRGQQVEAIILACTEIPLILAEAGQGEDLINPAQLLAEATVRYAIA